MSCVYLFHPRKSPNLSKQQSGENISTNQINIYSNHSPPKTNSYSMSFSGDCSVSQSFSRILFLRSIARIGTTHENNTEKLFHSAISKRQVSLFPFVFAKAREGRPILNYMKYVHLFLAYLSWRMIELSRYSSFINSVASFFVVMLTLCFDLSVNFICIHVISKSLKRDHYSKSSDSRDNNKTMRREKCFLRLFYYLWDDNETMTDVAGGITTHRRDECTATDWKFLVSAFVSVLLDGVFYMKCFFNNKTLRLDCTLIVLFAEDLCVFMSVVTAQMSRIGNCLSRNYFRFLH